MGRHSLYDNNGNLTGDGTNDYTWNTRNQLASMSGAGLTANFSYDAVGRRRSKTINGSTTSYLYDGPNIAQEQTGGSASANALTGGVDMFFSRTDASGTVTPLQDSLGSVVALADASGTIQTSYSYEPFGMTTTSGTANGNTQKYTGREDDGTALYYYRARYYSPSLQRFISEDPIGLAGRDVNFYAYVGNSPVMFRDPSGLERPSSYTHTLPSQSAPPLGGRKTDPGWWDSFFNDLGGRTFRWAAKFAEDGIRGKWPWYDPAKDPLRNPAAGFWGRPESLERHFRDHGTDFGSSTPEAYAQQASDFFRRSQAERLPTKVAADGVIRCWDPTTNEFGAYNPNGTTRTYYLPGRPGYFFDQPGIEPWEAPPIEIPPIP